MLSDRTQPGSFTKSHEQKAEKKEKKKKKKRKKQQKKPIVLTYGIAIFVSIRHVVLFFFQRHSTQRKSFATFDFLSSGPWVGSGK
jgi:hypothetical protein